MISHNAITENVVIAFLRSFAAAREGAVSVACFDPRVTGNGQHVLVALSSVARREVDDIGFL